MKAISLFQPLATLVALKSKRFETRDWRPRTGLIKNLAIAATKKSPEDYLKIATIDPCKAILRRHGISFLPGGVIVAIVDVTEILTTREWTRRFCTRLNNREAELDYIFGDYGPDRFAWHLENVRRLPEPIPCKGGQRIWTVPPEVEERILEQLETVAA